MIIDMHVHPFCREASEIPNSEEAFTRMFSTIRNPKRLKVMKERHGQVSSMSITAMIKMMDESGVDKACIVAMDMTSRYGVISVTNEDVSKLAKAYPARFIPFASVDPNLGRKAVDDLEHAVRELGCRGLKLVPPVQCLDFSDPKFQPLWEAALEMDIVVWTHVAHQLSHPGSDARLGHPMLIEPVALKYPNLKIVMGHCGFPWVWEAWSLAVRHPNVYVDISAYPKLYNHFPWDAYTKYAHFGAEDKVLFATDYPAHTWEETLQALNGVDISLEFKENILSKNAQRLLGI
jgi:predicted TIM-barrel fold metal-dependent hydrolase